MPEGSSVRFSVVVPTYNYGRYLRTALESVLTQKSNRDEVIVVDDASTDGTGHIARQYGDAIVYLRLNENVGPGGAWAEGIARAQGRYVCKLDADDWHLGGSLNFFEEVFERNPSAGMVAASVYAFHETDGRVLRVPVRSPAGVLTAAGLRKRILSTFFFHMPGISLRRSALKDELPRRDLWMPHDWEYLIRTLEGWSCVVLDRPVAVYRVHSSSVTRTAEQADRLQKDLALLSDLALDPDSDLRMNPRECDIFHLALGETYLRLFRLAESSPSDWAARLRLAADLARRSPGNGVLSVAVATTRVLADKTKGFVSWRFGGEATPVDDLLPKMTTSRPIDG